MAPSRTTDVPIHLRAQPGDYAEACLVPGDPVRARYIAERFLEAPRQVNAERGLLGFTGAYRGRTVSVQATGMGGPSAAIVVEELVRLGARRLLRVGTCGALAPDVALGDLVVVTAAVGDDGATRRYTGDEPHAAVADFALARAAVDAAGALARPVRVGCVVSTDLFYDPDASRLERWAARGVLAVEMEAAVVLTLGALRGVAAGCVLVASDLARAPEPTRLSDAELRRAVDAMTEVALEALARDGAG